MKGVCTQGRERKQEIKGVPPLVLGLTWEIWGAGNKGLDEAYSTGKGAVVRGHCQLD